MYRIRIRNGDLHEILEQAHEKLVPAVEVARREYLNNTHLVVEVIDGHGTVWAQYPRQTKNSRT